MVITGLTRNQFASNRTWVRIPSSPPTDPHKPSVYAGFYTYIAVAKKYASSILGSKSRCKLHILLPNGISAFLNGHLSMRNSPVHPARNRHLSNSCSKDIRCWQQWWSVHCARKWSSFTKGQDQPTATPFSSYTSFSFLTHLP